MHNDGEGYMVCFHCNYMEPIVKHPKSHAELIEENERLKKIIEQMNKEISHNAPQTAQD